MTKLTYPMLYITRKEKGDTQKKVASKLGISPQRYQLKESGKAIFNLNECQILSKNVWHANWWVIFIKN